MVKNRLENFKFWQYPSNIISRLIYIVIEMNLLIFSDMNISKIIFLTRNVPLYPADTIKFYLKAFFCVCKTNVYLTKRKDDVWLKILMQILQTEWKVEALFTERRNTSVTNSAHIQSFSFSCNWHN